MAMTSGEIFQNFFWNVMTLTNLKANTSNDLDLRAMDIGVGVSSLLCYDTTKELLDISKFFHNYHTK